MGRVHGGLAHLDVGALRFNSTHCDAGGGDGSFWSHRVCSSHDPGTYIVLAMAIYREVMSNNEPSCELDPTTRSQRATQISGLSETVTKREILFDLYSRFTEKG